MGRWEQIALVLRNSCGTILWCVFKLWPLLPCHIRTGHSSGILSMACDAKGHLGALFFPYSTQAIRSQIHKPRILAGAIVGAVGSVKSWCVFDLPCDTKPLESVYKTLAIGRRCVIVCHHWLCKWWVDWNPHIKSKCM